jgi:tetratricopeptide (TPR) repeat protein
MDADTLARTDRLKAVKSALILEARVLADRGFEASARELYQKAAQHELTLAELYDSLGRQTDARISGFSAGSCLVKAREYRQALPVLERVADHFPEARSLIARCRAHSDDSTDPGVPEVKALVELLLKKRLITEDEWEAAVTVGIPA